MVDATDRALVEELANETVGDVAPDESELFPSISQHFFADPDRTLKADQDKDPSLGFGAGVEFALVTPIVLAMTKEVVVLVTNQVIEACKDESPGLIRDLVRKMFKRFRTDEDKDPPPLHPDQLARVRQAALETARRLGTPEDQAVVLADSVVGKLAVSGT